MTALAKKKIHLLIPMSGQGTRYRAVGYTDPKPLIPVSGTPMIERLLQSFPQEWKTTFVMAENHRKTNLPEILKKIRPNSTQYFIEPHTEGPLRAIKKGLENVDSSEGIFVSYCDYGMIWDAQAFERFVSTSELDACVISYRGFHAHYLSKTNYAYSKVVDGCVKEVREKESFTSNRETEYASSGGYYFNSKMDLLAALDAQIQKKLQISGEYYTSLTVEALLRLKPHSKVKVFEIPYFFQWGTPDDLRFFEYWEKTFSAFLKFSPHQMKVNQVLMPMAGLGTRLKEVSSLPKPLIKIEQTEIYLRALKSLPQSDQKPIIVTTQEVSSLICDPNIAVLSLKETPAGQALTVEAGLKELSENGSIIVSACDHAIVLDSKVWSEFNSKFSKNCDAAVFTVRGFPQVKRSPQSFSYVDVREDSSIFAEVKSVSLKRPLTNEPLSEHLLVGTFWFKNKRLLADGISALKSEKLKGSELYLDTIFNYFIAQGLNVRIIPLDGYINWGDADSLAESLYYEEAMTGHKLSARSRYPGVQ